MPYDTLRARFRWASFALVLSAAVAAVLLTGSSAFQVALVVGCSLVFVPYLFRRHWLAPEAVTWPSLATALLELVVRLALATAGSYIGFLVGYGLSRAQGVPAASALITGAYLLWLARPWYVRPPLSNVIGPFVVSIAAMAVVGVTAFWAEVYLFGLFALLPIAWGAVLFAVALEWLVQLLVHPRRPWHEDLASGEH
jgi:hypothetical protein